MKAHRAFLCWGFTVAAVVRTSGTDTFAVQEMAIRRKSQSDSGSDHTGYSFCVGNSDRILGDRLCCTGNFSDNPLLMILDKPFHPEIIGIFRVFKKFLHIAYLPVIFFKEVCDGNPFFVGYFASFELIASH